MCINIQPFSKDIFEILNFCKDSKTKSFAVLPPNKDLVLECSSYGLNDFVFQTDIDKHIEFRLLRISDIDDIDFVNVKTFQYITYIKENREMYIRNSKIILTNFESILINYLIKNNGYCNLKDFQSLLLTLNSRLTPQKSLVVSINRFRKKVVYQTGYDILKSRYGFGYIVKI